MHDPSSHKPLRLWPGVVIVTLQWLSRFVLPVVVPDAALYGVVGGVIGGLAVAVWWLFFSRAPWSERLGAVAVMALALVVTSGLVHDSIATGMMGMMLPILAVPLLSLALVSWALASRRLSTGSRWASMAGATAMACGVLTLLRTGGITGAGESDLHWRWTASPEERLLARAVDDPGPPASAFRPAGIPDPTAGRESASASAAAGAVPRPAETPGTIAHVSEHAAAGHAADPPLTQPPAEWPGFRGPGRDSVVRGLRIETDWARKPPIELWRRPVGPGWSSFAIRGDLVYTQEQRGDDEVVSCYQLGTGEPVWRHRDPVRFWESNGGAGPRATPTVQGARVYTFGATGLVNALDADTGALLWSRDAAADTGVAIPDWGFAGSPLVLDDLVIVAVAGQLVAYDGATGERRWLGPSGGAGYSSPHLVRIGGVDQVLLLRGSRTVSVAPADGTLLWEHRWQPGVGIVQPALAPNGDVLITTGDTMGGVGIRRASVAHGPGGWRVEERWTSRGLKPYFNDFVVHEGYAFGFDGSILAAIDLETGERAWKGGRYGHGQLMLLPDQDLLLVLSEEGELALVEASPARHRELARFPAIEGKTWNHPVLVGDVLLVRNGQEMAAFRLALAGPEG